MFEKVFGKANSIQRKIITTSVIYILISVAVTSLCFYIFVHKSVNMKLIEISVTQREAASELAKMSNRSIRIAIISLICAAVLLVSNISRKMLKPIKKIKEATKKVASGDFTVQLQTDRKDELRRTNT